MASRSSSRTLILSLAVLLAAPAANAAQSLSDAIAEDYRTELKALFEHFHRNPELSFLEHETAARLADDSANPASR